MSSLTPHRSRLWAHVQLLRPANVVTAPADVLAVGGGAVLDVAGYAAGTAHRGIRLIRAPTTVLSQNDSGGVKNGINAFGTKNFLGTFEPTHCAE